MIRLPSRSTLSPSGPTSQLRSRIGADEIVELDEGAAVGQRAVLGDVEGEDAAFEMLGGEERPAVGRDGDAVGIVDAFGDAGERARCVEMEDGAGRPRARRK